MIFVNPSCTNTLCMYILTPLSILHNTIIHFAFNFFYFFVCTIIYVKVHMLVHYYKYMDSLWCSSLFDLVMSSTNHSYDRRACRWILYAQNKDKINTRRRLLYKNKLHSNAKNNMSTHNPNLFDHPLPPCTNPSTSTSTTSISTIPHLHDAHYCFCASLDKLSLMHFCSICKESYTGMKTKLLNGITSCFRCALTKSTYRFPLSNNMEPRPQPNVLSILTQIEVMLIARVNPILQVTHAHGGKYKCIGHTVIFP